MSGLGLKYGKAPATTDSRDLRLAKYVDDAVLLPKIPKAHSISSKVAADGWGMLGNDRYGDCTCAGTAHEIMLHNAQAGRTARFDDASVLRLYSAVSGFDPVTGANDNGANVRDVLKYRQRHGVLDADGKLHKIGVYVSIDPKRFDHVMAAMYLFDGVAIGWLVPDYAQREFGEGLPFDLEPGGSIEGGHYTPGFDYSGSSTTDTVNVVTWARVQPMTWRFFGRYVDEVWAYFDAETEIGGKSPEGFRASALLRDLQALRG